MRGKESLCCGRGGGVLIGLITEPRRADTNLARLLSVVGVTRGVWLSMTEIKVGEKTFQSGKFQVNIDAGCHWGDPGASRDEVALVEVCLQEQGAEGFGGKKIIRRSYVGWVVDGNDVFPMRGSFKDPYSKVTVEYLDGGIELLAEILKALQREREY